MNPSSALALSLAAFVLAGCVSTEEVSQSLSEPETFARAYRAALCDYVLRCGASQLGDGGDPCAESALPGQGAHEPVLTGVEIDTADAARCLDGLTGLACDRIAFPEIQALCGRAVVGTVPRGAPCTHDLECSEPFSWCDDSAQGGCACLEPRFGRPVLALFGDPCALDADCSSARCVDGACAFSQPTEPDEPGQPCGDHGDVAYPHCGAGLYCDDGACAPEVYDLPLGADCDVHNRCAWPLGCLDGACATKRVEGAPCRWASDCEYGLYCFEQQCRPRKADGEPCDDFELPPVGGDPGERNVFSLDECLAGSCIEGICGRTTFCVP